MGLCQLLRGAEQAGQVEDIGEADAQVNDPLDKDGTIAGLAMDVE